MVVVEKVCQSNNLESATKNGQIIVEVHGNIDISPAVIFRYLGEKFANMPDDHNEGERPNYLIRPKETTVSLSDIIDSNGSRHMKSPSDHFTNNANSSSEVRLLTNYSRMSFFTSIPDRFQKLNQAY